MWALCGGGRGGVVGGECLSDGERGDVAGGVVSYFFFGQTVT